jgi:antitoxin (DNA-binding transcriptional repressor) of toxin-antitoxin stability system
MKQVNIAEIKDHFSDYLKDVEAGNEVGICRRNVLVARLTAAHEKVPERNKTRLGCGSGTVTFMADLTEPMIPLSAWNMLGTGDADEVHS